MIQSVMIFFNDQPELIERALKSIKGKVDKIVAIDGPYKNFPHESIQSNDNVLNIVKQYADEVIIPTEAWNNQIQKRNAYLTANPGDYYLMIDADEELIGDLPALESDYYGITIKDKRAPESDNNNFQLRIFKAAEGLQYKRKHSWLYLKNELINIDNNDSVTKLESPYILHKSFERNEDRVIDKNKYYDDRKAQKEEPDHYEHSPKVIKPKPIKLIALHHYCGFDTDNEFINVKEGDELCVHTKKWQQLKEDYPEYFKEVK